MPDVKFSQLTQITAAQSSDYIPIVDVSDPLMSENGSNAVISIGDLTSSLFDGMADGSISISKLQTNPTFTGNVTLPNTTSIGAVGATEIGFLSGLRNNIQYQLDNPFFPVPGTLTIGPGTTTNAPLRLMAGINMQNPVSGSVEFDGSNLYYTNNASTRQILATKTYVDTAVAGMTIGTIPTETITSDMIVNNTIVNADISPTAGITGTKITPNFGAGNIITTGSLTVGDNAQFISRIGTTNVTPQVQIIALGNDSAGTLLGRFSTDAASSRHSFIKSRAATKGDHTIVNSGDDLGLLSFGGSDGSKIVEAARIHTEVDTGNTVVSTALISGTRYKILLTGNTNWSTVGWVATGSPPSTPAVGDVFIASGPAASGSNGTATIEPATNSMPGRILFSTTAKGAATVTERMRITSDGGIQIGTTTAEHSSLDSTCLLQMNSTSRGFRPPAMTTTQRNAIVGPMQGLIIYNATTGKLNFFSGTSSAWEVITSAPGA